MTRTVLITLILLICGVAPGYAQKQHKRGGGKWHQEFMEFKLKFMAQEIGLQENQKKRFNELYIRMENEKGNAFHAAHQAVKVVKNNAKATDAQYNAASMAMVDLKLKEAQIEKNYYTKFKTFLTAKQMYLMKKAERKFTRTIMKMDKHHKKK